MIKRVISLALAFSLLMLYPTETVEVPISTYETEIIETETETEMVVDVMSMDRPVLAMPLKQQKEPQYISLGTFLVTAYCSCYICCEEHALNRPKDENGNEIVKGSIGQVLTPQYSIAVDPRVIPYGTKVYFNGMKEHLAQDCGGSIKQKRIDLYFSDHQEALNWGKQYHEIFVLVED